jgi:uncharacterized metal-binding protein
LHSEHGFKQAPYEEITKEQYEQLTANIKELLTISQGDIELDECSTGACPIK